MKASEIVSALRKREALVAEVRSKLGALGGHGLRFLRGPEAFEPRPVRRARRKASAKAQSAWRNQGKYLGAVRHFSRTDRAKVKAIRQKSGVRAAIAAARKPAKA